MTRSFVSASLSLILVTVVCPAALGNEPSDDTLRFERLAEGVYAAIQPADRTFNDSNSLIVMQDDGPLVVDTQEDAGFVRRVIEKIRGLTDQPVRGVINTHWHSDHTQGNRIYLAEFGDTLRIYGHRTLTRDVPERAATYVAERVAELETVIPEAEEQLARGKSRKGEPLTEEQQARQRQAIEQAQQWVAANRDVEFVAPTVTYRQMATIGRGERRVELRHFRAHTRGDTVVWLPKSKVLATGDLLDAMPYVGHGYPSDWIETLESLREYDFEVLVPGHGPIYRGKQQLEVVLAYLRSLVRQVAAAVEQGKDLEQTRQLVDLAEAKQAMAGDDEAKARFFDSVLPEAVERAWLEARGELKD